MTLLELEAKRSNKLLESRTLETDNKEKLNSVAALQRSIDKAISENNRELALSLTKEKRDLEDEIAISNQVLESIKNSPAFSIQDLSDCWDEANTGYNERIETLYPELQQAYTVFNEMVAKLLVIRQDAFITASQLRKLGDTQDITFRPYKQFERKTCIEFWDRKLNFKLNCLDVDVLQSLEELQ